MTEDKKTSELREGDILEYTSDERAAGHVVGRAWAREEMAYVHLDSKDGTPYALDTFWPRSGADGKRLTKDELASATVLGNVRDCTRVSKFEYEQYEKADRLRVTSQHGLRVDYFVRAGAEPSLDVRIESARARLADAEAKVHSAVSGLCSAQRELTILEVERDNARRAAAAADA